MPTRAGGLHLVLVYRPSEIRSSERRPATKSRVLSSGLSPLRNILGKLMPLPSRMYPGVNK